MKNANGFTMIELLGMITIIGVLLVMTVPNLTSTLKNSEDKAFENFSDNLLIAAETYVENNPELFPSLKTAGGRAVITIQDLIENDLIKNTVVDPKTDTEVPTTNVIIAKKNDDNTIDYIYSGASASLTSYVQDSLILLYDGYNKPVKNTLKDLSGNNKHGEIKNSENYWNGDSIVLDGTDDYINLFNNLDVLKDKPYTIEMVLQLDQDNAFLIGNNSTNIQFVSKNLSFNFNGQSITADSFYTNGKLSVSFVVDKINKRFEGYSNAISKVQTTNESLSSNLDFTNFKIGYGNDINLKGKVYSVRIYDKALTESDIKTNYEVDKTRFGLEDTSEND